METATPVRSDHTHNVLVMLLALGLLAGGWLLFLATTGPAAIADVVVGPGESVPCTTGSGAPVCYRYDVTNEGTASSFVRCQVAVSGAGTAVFGNGAADYEGSTPLEAGETWRMYVRVQPGTDDVVSEPMVACATSS